MIKTKQCATTSPHLDISIVNEMCIICIYIYIYYIYGDLFGSRWEELLNVDAWKPKRNPFAAFLACLASASPKHP